MLITLSSCKLVSCSALFLCLNVQALKFSPILDHLSRQLLVVCRSLHFAYWEVNTLKWEDYQESVLLKVRYVLWHKQHVVEDSSDAFIPHGCFSGTGESNATLFRVTDGFVPHLGPVIRSCGVFFVISLNKLLENSQSASDLRRHNAHVASHKLWDVITYPCPWYLPLVRLPHMLKGITCNTVTIR